MSTDPITDFQDRYLRTWTEPDPELRRASVNRIWAADGRLVVSSLGITVQGTKDIAAHIARVHDDLIADKGLRFTYDQQVKADDALLLRWSMLGPSGEAVGRGVDLVFRGSDGRVETVYMFMGVN
ncbi:nuclear transport factor 2 family protein [Amycolatopsis sp. H20-H5]|uniref:nuclear transport factor 2 family protein n=1 Tax=Amycolatopsis sp. H20-H5 TaxID=3046309 RepID=UPI002DBB7AB1|nr:nuclear transport factor 2 family protein [Amycolatopsis sp. H20-H5]MEC3981602.1 nuclear transport factor 2 family protein [Amycolatopsis sp. H20-H5]